MNKSLKCPHILSIVFFVSAVCLFGPLELYLTNTGEFWFSLPQLFVIAAILCLIAVAVLGLIACLLKGRAPMPGMRRDHAAHRH